MWRNSKPRKGSRSVRVYGLFGGKKDDKGDDSSSKVSEPCIILRYFSIMLLFARPCAL